MGKNRRVVIGGILTLLLVLLPLTGALASYNPEGKAGVVEPQAFQYLAFGSSSLDFSGTTALCYGCTEAKQVVDYIAVTITLQRWNGSRWENVASWPFSKYNTFSVEGYKGISVARGYYYRVQGFHKVTHNGVTETTYSYTDSIYLQ